MTRKKTTVARHQVMAEILPTLSTALVSFANGRSEFLSDKFGSISVDTGDDRFTFKINDLISIVDTQDDFIIFQMRSAKEGKPVDELIGFYKKDVKMIYADFHNEVRYKSEKKQNLSADKMVS